MEREFKTAIVHDLLLTVGGAEKTLECIYQLYPSPIYTLILNRDAIKNSIVNKAHVTTSFIQSFPWSKKKYRNYLPFYPIAIEQFNLSSFNIIFSSSFVVAKGLLSNTEQLHICYLHNPIRPAWELYHQFLSQAGNGKGIKGLFTRLIFHYLRQWDLLSANRVDYFIANSRYTANRIKKLYRRDSKIIYPPVDIELFELDEVKEDYYVTASRLVYHKRIDLIVQAFTTMPDKKLVVLGDGPELDKLKSIATSNVAFLGYQSQDNLVRCLQKAKAFVFAAQEDFGIAPIEAMACGTPVLALGKGGALETIIQDETGIFFYEQTAQSICTCVKEFELKSYLFNAFTIRSHAEKFSRQRFEKEFKEFADEKIANFYTANSINEKMEYTIN